MDGREAPQGVAVRNTLRIRAQFPDTTTDRHPSESWDPFCFHSDIPGKKAIRVNERLPCVYILASGPRGTLFTGVTSCLAKRIPEHTSSVVSGFTSKYGVYTLVWYEIHDDMTMAIAREKAIKAWKRIWKIQLIETTNSDWRDLSIEIV